ncbi:hypothetical protein EUX98_g6105 [Antrodiella citrinella]|uniref:NTF2 domain-containing protein n=1 Tax=Antrodiella citrinella TaxID=2447956 RepID=A0A4S4MXD0_9APHY|nr:hypothetical protein EUX98_g6105 [Antrodiella citrinella]
MTAAIVLPNLTNWLKQHITTLYTVTDRTAFNNAFNAFLTQDASITVNGKKVTKDEYMQQLLGQKFEESGAQVNFLATVEVPADQNQPQLAGDVGTSFQATVDEQFLVLGAPETRSVNSSLNVVIVQDKSITPPHPTVPVRGGIFDPRRVSVLNQITLSKQNSVLIPLPNPAGPSTDQPAAQTGSN